MRQKGVLFASPKDDAYVCDESESNSSCATSSLAKETSSVEDHCMHTGPCELLTFFLHQSSHKIAEGKGEKLILSNFLE